MPARKARTSCGATVRRSQPPSSVCRCKLPLAIPIAIGMNDYVHEMCVQTFRVQGRLGSYISII
eukprot:6054353-Pleurochrysis_carterae.AAC.2